MANANLKKERLKFKLKNYASLADSQVWINYLKPDLEKIKSDIANEESEAESEFEAIKRDVARSTTIKTINRIIGIIEGAENKINKL